EVRTVEQDVEVDAGTATRARRRVRQCVLGQVGHGAPPLVGRTRLRSWGAGRRTELRSLLRARLERADLPASPGALPENRSAPARSRRRVHELLRSWCTTRRTALPTELPEHGELRAGLEPATCRFDVENQTVPARSRRGGSLQPCPRSW